MIKEYKIEIFTFLRSYGEGYKSISLIGVATEETDDSIQVASRHVDGVPSAEWFSKDELVARTPIYARLTVLAPKRLPCATCGDEKRVAKYRPGSSDIGAGLKTKHKTEQEKVEEEYDGPY